MSTTTNGTINVQQASLKTATITVQALTIDKRQVTLAVFRQLREERLVNQQTGEFAGLPWGTVNYCPDKKSCGRRLDHLHVVWQKGDELRRAIEEPPGRFDPWSELTDDWLVLALAEGWTPDKWLHDYGTYCPITFVDGMPPLRAYQPNGDRREGLRYALGLDDEPYLAADNDDPYWVKQREDHERKIEEGRTRVAALREKWSNSGAVAQRIVDEMNEQYRAWRRCGMRWHELQALDQLFIAT